MPKLNKQQKNTLLVAILGGLGIYYFYSKKKQGGVIPPINPPIPPIKPNTSVPDTYIVNTMSTSLNIREKPDVSSKVVGTLMKGEKFLGQKSENPSWIKVFGGLGTIKGYVSAQYAKLFVAVNPNSGVFPPSSGGTYSSGGTPTTGGNMVQGQPSATIKKKVRIKTAGGNLNVREENSTSSKIIAQLKNGDIVEAKGVLGAGPWEKIVLPSGKEGWVSSAFIVYL